MGIQGYPRSPQSFTSGIDPKDSVRAATTADIVLSGLQTVDGVVLIEGDRVLVKDQTDAEDNGIRIASAADWIRSSDTNSSDKVSFGMYAFVVSGTINGGNGWVLSTPDPINLGVTELTFVQVSSTGALTAGNGLVQLGLAFNVVGTAGRISVSADAVDIDPTYVASIAQGGTAATTAAGAPFALKGSNTDLTAITQAGVLSSGTEIYNGAGTFTATGNNGLVSCSGGSAATLNLPAYAGSRKLTLKVRSSVGAGSGSLNVVRQGSDLILVNGNIVTSTTVGAYQTATFQAFDGALIGVPGLTVWMRIETAIWAIEQGGTGSSTYNVPYRGVSTNNYAITASDYMIGFQVDTIGAGGQATIPNPLSPSLAGKVYLIHTGGSSSNTITITSPGNGFVDTNGSSFAFPTVTLANNELIQIYGDSGYWRINKVLPVDRGGTGATTAAGAPFALKGANTDLSALNQCNISSNGLEYFAGAGTFTATGNFGHVLLDGGTAATLRLPSYVVNRKNVITVKNVSSGSGGPITIVTTGSDLMGFENGIYITSTILPVGQAVTFQGVDGAPFGFPGLTAWNVIMPSVAQINRLLTGTTFAAFLQNGTYEFTSVTGCAVTLPVVVSRPSFWTSFRNSSATGDVVLTTSGGQFICDSTGSSATTYTVNPLCSVLMQTTLDGVDGWRVVSESIATLPVNRGGTGAITAAGAPFALKGINTDIQSIATSKPNTMTGDGVGTVLNIKTGMVGGQDLLNIEYTPTLASLFKIDAAGSLTMPGNMNITGWIQSDNDGLYAGPGSGNFIGSANGSLFQVLQADVVGREMHGAVGQTVPLLRCSSSGGTLGDRLLLSAAGHLTVPSITAIRKRVPTTSAITLTVTTAMDLILFTASGAINADLPTAASAIQQTFTIKNVATSTANVTVDGNGAETIDNALTYVLLPGDSVEVYSDGGVWHVL